MFSSLIVASFALHSQTFRSEGATLEICNLTGYFSIALGEGMRINHAFGEVKLSDGTIAKTTEFPVRQVTSESKNDLLGQATEVTVLHSGRFGVEIRQIFQIYDSEVIVRLDLLDPSSRGTNQMAPIVSGAVTFPESGALHSLFVPYDNDKYARFSSDAWNQGRDAGDVSSEVGALYNDSTRTGLIVGSIDHDTWKSGIRFAREGGLRATAGVTNRYTHDTQPHGTVRGAEVQSPRFVVGRYDDWRTGLERFGDINAKVKSPLKWEGEVPFGWNSWSGHKSAVRAADANAALEFIRDELPGFRSGGVAYINLDSYWDNLTPEERQAFVKKAQASGLKAGVYWAPFVNWGEPDWNTVAGYKFGDIQLKDASGNYLPKLSGAWPLDPTHPGTLQRIEETLDGLVKEGFDYIKLDFLTHGSLEGEHYNQDVDTGTEAYHIGMAQVLKCLDERRAGRPIFISISIAPMFPHGYAHARRISCDTFSDISASEYFLNSQNYGWWQAGRLYPYNDPDHVCVYQAAGEAPTSEAEGRTRFVAAVIGGGMMLQGDNLTNPIARERVRAIFSNQSLISLAQRTPSFRPVQGNTGERAGDLFIYREDEDTVYVAAFNFDRNATRAVSVPMGRLDLQGSWQSKELWTNVEGMAEGVLELAIPPMDCIVLRLTRKP